jgi:hypothetical protein
MGDEDRYLLSSILCRTRFTSSNCSKRFEQLERSLHLL